MKMRDCKCRVGIWEEGWKCMRKRSHRLSYHLAEIFIKNATPPEATTDTEGFKNKTWLSNPKTLLYLYIHKQGKREIHCHVKGARK
jgi:hypothetical protein